MPFELLLLLLAWAATLSLIVVLPWAVIRLVVGILEADVSKPGADHEHAQPRHIPDADISDADISDADTSDAEAVNALAREPDAVEPAEPVPATATPDEDGDR